MTNSDPFTLSRFLTAQEGVYSTALEELKRGRKDSCWMWFVFPQIEGLGRTSTSQFYAIKSADEAEAYLSHPVLGRRLIECCEALLEHTGLSASEIFGFPDDLKLKSSMTLFAAVSGEKRSVFHRVLERYFDGIQDRITLSKLSGE